MIDLSGKSDALHAQLLRKIIKVEPGAERNRREDIANMSIHKWPEIEDGVNGSGNHLVEAVLVLDSDDDIGVDEIIEEADTSFVIQVNFDLLSING